MSPVTPKIPDVYSRNGTTPEAFERIVSDIVLQVAKKYIFGSHEYEDIRQHCFIEALQALHRTKGKCYDKTRPLDSFLRVHIENRLKNFKRDNHYRGHSPCKTCPLFDPNFEASDNQCLGFEQRFDCDKYRAYRKRNDSKASLCGAADQAERDEPTREGEPILEELCRRELLDLIDRNLAADIRPDFLRLIANVSIPHKRRDIVREAIKAIILDSGQFPELEVFFEEI